MSQANAEQFLSDILHHPDLRPQFEAADNPEEFLQIAQKLGYDFSTADLEAVAHAHSQNVNQRRQTGIWPWLRQMNWIDRSNSKSS
jgi:predicted ribosomally synthesized peptide with nif11-like leader